ncbi:hypothetical protein M1K46_03370 [Fictibacillus sp. WQ 8-8]|uniref:hypothetical protein n=1 Tax=Fictibacillus sp. WQ 8-8 TaxID=2938788 RepID=UPI00210B3705|nr:hypothetical protein [Fictibacillus sp. WQ 8-8]MCQ6264706.1 hypothetical protein [Fictibacillus sp. WQ 8-8]
MFLWHWPLFLQVKELLRTLTDVMGDDEERLKARFKDEVIRYFRDDLEDREKLNLPLFSPDHFKDDEIRSIYASLLPVQV